MLRFMTSCQHLGDRMHPPVFDLALIFRLPSGIAPGDRDAKFWPDTPVEPDRLTRREVESLFKDQLAGLRRGDDVRRLRQGRR